MRLPTRLSSNCVGAAAITAHQVVLQLWNFLALVLDSLAVATQALVGAALGAGDAVHAKSVAWRATVFSTIAAGALAVVLAVGAPVLPQLFTDTSVLAAIGVPWWFLVAQLPVAGVVFALNGVLLGAGDAALCAHQRKPDHRPLGGSGHRLLYVPVEDLAAGMDVA